MPPPLLSRRDVLARALGVAGLGAAVALAAPQAPVEGSPVDSKPSRRDWDALAVSLAGRLVRPTSPGYNRDRLLYNSRFADPRPQAIAYCASREDVARCVDFVARRHLAVTARSGGHSYGGYSSCGGLVIDVSRLNTIAVDLRGNIARVGAGARLIDVYEALGREGRLLPAGTCPTVGIAGLALGGGVGVFGRRHGLTCDNLRSATIVDASATALQVDAAHHDDLLWASRGGGGGNFGVVTEFEFDVHPLPTLTLFSERFPWGAAGDVLEGWSNWVSQTPDDLWSNCLLLKQGTFGYLVEVGGVFCGTPSELSPHLGALSHFIGVRRSSSFVGSDDYLEAMKVEAGCSRLSVAACHLAGSRRLGVLSREAFQAKSSYLNAPASTAHATKLVRALETLGSDAPTLGGAIAFDAYGGAIGRVPARDTAFVHRDALAGSQASFSWSTSTPLGEIATGRRWLETLGASVFDPTTGAYQNYIDPTLVDWARAYYGENLERLCRVKRRYDPDDLVSFAQSIPLRA
jgi:FAD/FMN-containing dehydrogenase